MHKWTSILPRMRRRVDSERIHAAKKRLLSISFVARHGAVTSRSGGFDIDGRKLPGLPRDRSVHARLDY